MTPETVHRIAMKIRHEREDLRSQARWADAHKGTYEALVTETFQWVTFWREVYDIAEEKASQLRVR